jgi:cysteine sulfinate desulfinase/cysteine desulfurase-like protein
LHSFGQTAAAAVTQARQQIADFFIVSRRNLFTSGATELITWRLRGFWIFLTQFKVKQNFSAHILSLAPLNIRRFRIGSG